MFDLKKRFVKQEHINIPGTIRSDATPSPTMPIGYDAQLIGKLKDDHEDMISYFNTMIECARLGKDKGVINNMMHFRNLLTSHLITENTKLYMFLHYVYKRDSDTHELVNEFRKEMVGIGKVVTEFIKQWSQVQFTADNREEFVREATKISEALLRRISTEEERLYEIYEFSPTVMSEASG